jgi:phosphotriesterase-related protein
MTIPTHDARFSRREAFTLLGTAAGAGVVAAGSGRLPLLAQQPFTSAEPPTFAAGAIIRTQQGDVDPGTLANGATLFHEHVGRADIDLAVNELRECAFNGLGCIVDAATGRRTADQIRNLGAIAARSDVRIVMAGGYFEDIGFSIYPVRVAEMSEDGLVEELVGDATAQRWGAFGEIASSLEMRPDERKVHRAVARAHVRTGLPIFTHTPHESCPSCAMEQMDTIGEQGVDFSHVVIGHMATIKPEHDPLGTHKEVARRGAFIGLDTLGHEMGRSDIPAHDKVRMVQDLLEAGLEDHILLSSDQGNERQFNRYYGHGWASVLMQFVPKLRFAGVPEETISKILVDNPRRFLAFVPKG